MTSGPSRPQGQGPDGAVPRPALSDRWSSGSVAGANALSAFDSEGAPDDAATETGREAMKTVEPIARLPRIKETIEVVPTPPPAQANPPAPSEPAETAVVAPIQLQPPAPKPAPPPEQVSGSRPHASSSPRQLRPEPHAAKQPARISEPVTISKAVLVWMIIGLAATLSVVAAIVVNYQRSSVTAAQPAAASAAPAAASTVAVPAQVTFETTPPGAEVLRDGQVQGITPLKLAMTAGHYEMVLRRGTDERVVPIDVEAGTQIVQRIEFAAPSTATAKIVVATDPAGARVLLDGEPKGVSPLTLSDVSAGRHRVSVINAAGASLQRQVTVEGGTTTSVMFSLSAAPALEVGWLTVVSPFELKILESNDVIGTSASTKIIVPAGIHELDLVNTGLAYQVHRRVAVEAGKTAELRIDARAPVNVNARPWADVFVDGAPVGTTPIANLSLTLGTHQVVFRHPDQGERRQDIVVTSQGPNRFSMDMTK